MDGRPFQDQAREVSNQQGFQDMEFSDPAEVLVELARRGDLDPWDVDIAKTTERFLEYVDSLEKGDLRIPGRTLLYASILLRMKSEAMEEGSEEDDEPTTDEEAFPEMEEPSYNLPRPPVRRKTRRPVTLEELIGELKKAEIVGRRKALREKENAWVEEEPRIQDLSHEEGIDERILVLTPIVEQLFQEKDVVSFTEVQGDRVLNYISLLFMAQRGQVWLEQEKIFQELFLRRPGEEEVQTMPELEVQRGS